MTNKSFFNSLIIVSVVLMVFSTVTSMLRTSGLRKVMRPGRLPISSITRLLSTRPKANDLTLDSYLASTQPELISAHVTSRKSDAAMIEKVQSIHELRNERNQLIVAGDKARNIRKTHSKDIGMLMKEKKLAEVEVLKAQVEDANAESHAANERLELIEKEISLILSSLPNLLDDSVPEGHDEEDNIIVKTWGEEYRKVGEGYLWHDELANRLNGMDMEAAARMSGSRFSVLIGNIARLERAITQYFLDYHIKNQYMEVTVPYIVSRSTLENTGQLPKFEDDLFHIKNHYISKEDAFLIPTAEVPLTNLFRNQLLNESDLPISLVCNSPSFRAEAGSHGRDTRGLLRQHQFSKVEIVKICTPETSKIEYAKLIENVEELLVHLKLPYRKVLLCSGDTGFSARICYDIEVWLPGQQAYREISSCSNCYDFQAKRMNLRYRPDPPSHSNNTSSGTSTGEKASTKEGINKKYKKNVFPHTINGSGLAVGRALVAILENYQLADGSVEVPVVLRPYMGGLSRIESSSSSVEGAGGGSSSRIRDLYHTKTAGTTGTASSI